MHRSEPDLGLGFFYFAVYLIEIYTDDESQATWARLLFLDNQNILGVCHEFQPISPDYGVENHILKFRVDEKSDPDQRPTV